MTPPPIPASYWVEPGRFLAGRSPLAYSEPGPRLALASLLEAGIDTFFDLTRREEFAGRSYAPLVSELGPARDPVYHHFPIDDFGIPSREGMRAILDRLDSELAAGRKVYLHCYAGLGRTGVTVGCYLARHGRRGTAALEELRRLRAAAGLHAISSPQTQEQVLFVRDWKEEP